MKPSNEQIALLLDPEHKRADWWKRECQECGQLSAHLGSCRRPLITGPWRFTGPDFYVASVCEEEIVPIILASGCAYNRTAEFTVVSLPNKLIGIMRYNHQIAIIMALIRISGNVR